MLHLYIEEFVIKIFSTVKKTSHLQDLGFFLIASAVNSSSPFKTDGKSSLFPVKALANPASYDHIY